MLTSPFQVVWADVMACKTLPLLLVIVIKYLLPFALLLMVIFNGALVGLWQMLMPVLVAKLTFPSADDQLPSTTIVPPEAVLVCRYVK